MKTPDQHNPDSVIAGHTSRSYDEELGSLRASLTRLGRSVLQQARDTLSALAGKDIDLARSIIQRENRVDLCEIDIDARVLSTIARRAPLGSDLRMVIAVSKGVVDLERISDEAAKIADIVVNIYGSGALEPNSELIRDVHQMGCLAIATLERAVDLYERLDDIGARELQAENHQLEAAFEDGLRRLMTYVMEDSRNIGFMVDMVLAMKAYERIAAHAQNLAEFVIYQVEGEDIRHSHP